MDQTWNSYISSLNPNSLPRKVKVTEGNYFSGSLNNLSFSNGDIMTVVDLIPSHIRAEVMDGEQHLGTVTIPVGYEGTFRLIADPVPFKTVADLVCSVHVPQGPAPRRSLPHFKNLVPIATVELSKVLKERQILALIGLEEREGKQLLRCELATRQPPLQLLLPLDCCGQFQECQDEQLYTMDTIVRQKLLTGRPRRVRVARGNSLQTLSPHVPKHFNGHLVLHPSFLVMALLPGEYEISIPSNLDIRVADVTGLGQNPGKFMTMRQIYSMERTRFPLRVRVTSVVTAEPFLLQCGQLLTVLETREVRKFLVTELSGGRTRRHFLIPATYQGSVLWGGRYFRMVSDITRAAQQGQVRFRAHRDYSSPAEPFTSFATNECFVTLQKSTVTAEMGGELHRVDALRCQNIATNALATFPLFAHGDFLELALDPGVGKLQELCQVPRLPCHIRVVSPDPTMARDPLFRTEELRVENIIMEQFLIVEAETWPERMLEIPVEKTCMEVLVVEERLQIRYVRWGPLVAPQEIEEIPEEEALTYSNCLIAPHPPPRPPKPRSLS
uniref:CABIT domain-containing protein n=1 Tax=Cavia porcellus TaxID=10141 RepID=H0VYY3_CAVPO